MDIETRDPLSAGDPLRAYLPLDTRIYERSEGVYVQDPNKTEPIFYRKAPVVDTATTNHFNDDRDETTVQDIIIIGEVSMHYYP